MPCSRQAIVIFENVMIDLGGKILLEILLIILESKSVLKDFFGLKHIGHTLESKDCRKCGKDGRL